MRLLRWAIPPVGVIAMVDACTPDQPKPISLPIPTDFIFLPWLSEEGRVEEKFEGPAYTMPGGGSDFGVNTAFESPFLYSAYYISVRFSAGFASIEVDEETYDQLSVGAMVSIRYRKGRWTGAIEARII